MSYCGSIPGTCGHKETCLDTLCEGHPANHLGGGQPMAFYPMALHRIPELSEAHKRGFVAPREMEEDKTEQAEPSYWPFLIFALIVLGAVCGAVYQSVPH